MANEVAPYRAPCLLAGSDQRRLPAPPFLILFDGLHSLVLSQQRTVSAQQRVS